MLAGRPSASDLSGDCPELLGSVDVSAGFVGFQLAQRHSSFFPEPLSLSSALSPASHSLVSEIDFGHCKEVLINVLDKSRDSLMADVGLLPAKWVTAHQVSDEMTVRGPVVGKDSLMSDLQCINVSSMRPDGVYAGRNVSSKFTFNSAPDVRKPYADVLKDGFNEGVLRSDTQVMVDSNCRGEYYLAGLNPLPNSFSQFVDENLRVKDGVSVKTPMIKDGRPVIILTEEELLELSKPLHLTLIGKFPAGRPKWVTVNKFFFDLKLRGEFKIANLDARHMYIHLPHMDDYIRLFSKQFQYINGFLIKFLKWTLDFNVNNEPSVCPVWISLPLLGLYLYTSAMMFSIASVFGRPLRLDYATSHWSRPSTARILVEMDVKIKHSNEVWIGSDFNGYFQKVCFENLPSYCMHCRKTGHSDDNCFLLFPELRKEHVRKNIISKGHDINYVDSKVLEADKDGKCGCCGVPSLHENQVCPVGDASICNGVVCLEQQGITRGVGLVEPVSDGGLFQAELMNGNVSLCQQKQFLYQQQQFNLEHKICKEILPCAVIDGETVCGVDAAGCGASFRPLPPHSHVSLVGDLISGERSTIGAVILGGAMQPVNLIMVNADISSLQQYSLDSVDGQALLVTENQFLHVDDVGNDCSQRHCVLMDGGSMGLDQDVNPHDDFVLHSLPYGGSCDFSIAGCNMQNKAPTSKQFTRSSLKEIDGQQLFLQWHGTGKNIDKIIDLIDRVLDDKVKLEELKRQRENVVVLKEEEKKKREEKKVAAAARLQVKLDSKKSQGKGKGKKK